MECNQIQFENIKVQDLYAFACRAYERGEVTDLVPIGKHRALAHTNNPYADDTDIALMVAYIDGRCVAYLGLLPGLLRVGTECERVYWLSTYYVRPDFRRTAVGIMLLMHALALRHDLFVTEMSPEAERVYRGLGFKELRPLTYYRINVDAVNVLSLLCRSASKVLKKVGVDWEVRDTFMRLSQRIYSPVKNVVYRALLGSLEINPKDIWYNEIEEISEEDTEGCRGERVCEFHRGKDVINWMLRYRWVKEKGKVEVGDEKYYFSEVRDTFRYMVLRVYSSNKEDYKGFVVLSYSVKDMSSIVKVLDFGVCGDEDYETISCVVMKCAQNWGAECVEMPVEVGSCLNRGIIGRLLLSAKRRIYLYRMGKEEGMVGKSLNDIELRYCDGDTGFT